MELIIEQHYAVTFSVRLRTAATLTFWNHLQNILLVKIFEEGKSQTCLQRDGTWKMQHQKQEAVNVKR